MIKLFIDIFSSLRSFSSLRTIISTKREKRRLKKLREMGMSIGKNVYIPITTYLDTHYCYLITLGDNVRFGPNCTILAHDATMLKVVLAARIGLVTIHESCSIGFGAVILPGVEIGARSIIGAGSVVSSNIPSDSIAVGNPAKVIASTRDIIRYHKIAMKKQPIFASNEYNKFPLSKKKRDEIINKLREHSDTSGYMK